MTTNHYQPLLIKGADLTDAQKKQLTFHGMSNPKWVKNHSFYFNADGTKCEDNGYHYPVCHSLKHLPY